MDDLHSKLISLWHDAGRPTSRALARDAGISHTTVAEMIKGTRIPSMAKYKAVVEALDGEWDDFESLYPVTPHTRTIIVQESPQDVLTAILGELRAIRELLERRHPQGGSDS